MSAAAADEVVWRPDPLDVSIDIVGACNLACPACGHGQFPDAARYLGTMDPALFERLLDKLEADLAPGRPRVHLFNWGEPLLHPGAAGFVRRVKARGLVCRLSSNLVRPRDLRGVVEAGPDWLRVSVSGFTQGVYGQSHRGGDVERVKENMRLLRSYLDELDAHMAVEVNYHVYRHNLGDYEPMRQLARELGFGFQPIWSIAGSPERVIRWLERGVPPEDAPHVARLVHSPELARDIALRHRHLLAPGECPLRAATLINADGSVDLCCAAYDVAPIAPSYLDVTPDELRRRKAEHTLCGPCMAHGLHLTAIQAGRSERDARGLEVLAALSPAAAAAAG